MKQKATIALFVVTIIWGWTFVWLKQALDTAEIYSSGNQTNIVATLFVALRFGFAIGLFFIFVPSALLIGNLISELGNQSVSE